MKRVPQNFINYENNNMQVPFFMIENKRKQTKKTLLIYLFFSFSFILFSQSIKFEGTVLDEKSKPVESAKVTIEETTFSKKTDEKGKFTFNEEIPLGEHMVTITKAGFVSKFFVISVEVGKDIIIDKVKIKLTKDEKRRRWMLGKIQKEEERRIKRDRKKAGIIVVDNKDEDVLEKEQEPTVVVDTKPEPEVEVVIEIPQIKQKYANEFNVPISSISNVKLYEFIDSWRGISYLSGGTTKEGVDSSSLTQQLFQEVFDLSIERSTKKQYKSENTDKFTDKESLLEGDLIFFKGSKDDVPVYVGVYLTDNKFVHSTPKTDKNGYSGVIISDLKDARWNSKYICGGRRYN